MNTQYGGFTPPQPINQPGAGASGIPAAAPAPNFNQNVPVPSTPNTQTNPGGPAPLAPGQPAPAAPIPGQTADATPPVDYKQRFNDSQKHITQLQDEKRVSLATIEEQSAKLGQYQGRMNQIRAELSKQEEIYKNPQYSEVDRNIAFGLWNKLETQYGELHRNAETTHQKIQEDKQYTNQQQANYTQRYNMKMATIENEMMSLVQDPDLVREYGSSANVYQTLNQHVMPATANDPYANFVFNEYVYGRATLKDVYNAAVEPQRRILQTIYKKETNNVAAGGGFQPQQGHPYQPKRGNGVFS